ncbi:MAG: HAMP domain-containing sensor histidine kinase [Bacteroidales bacterium]|nr:HAMP domain-containing sensor histidine kinase [Bacteroidales bacterium]
MKLLTRTSRYYLFVSLVVFIITGIVFYHLLLHIFYRQLDETLQDEKVLVEQTINYSDSVPDFRLVFGHLIDVTILNNLQKKTEHFKDTLLYNSEEGKFLSYRHLFVENTSFRQKGYTINIYKPLRETEKLVTEIVIAISLIFISLILVLVFVNYFIAQRSWIPFYRTLHNLNIYDINQEKPLVLIPTNTHEFELLNQALEKMSTKIRQDFLNLKEFNENAAHELQTPLAIIKSKMDLLIQDERLTEEQLRLISSINDATTRMSKLNQGLLLISKIENQQFAGTESVNLAEIIDKTVGQFEEMIDHKQITITRNISSSVNLHINRVLAEILVTNLISNAIRHNIPCGSIHIFLDSKSLVITNTGLTLDIDPEGLFERFRKSGSRGDSIGLGLSIVRKIADLYQMEVTYQYTAGNHTLKIIF